MRAVARAKNRTISSAMPTATQNSFVRSLRNSFRRRKKPDLSQQLEVDENDNSQALGVNDLQFTIKTNNAQDAINVTSGLANYKCKFLGKKEVDGKSGVNFTDEALRHFKTLRERKKPRIIIQVNPEVIRVVSAKDRTLLFDQAVDKISFCAPSNTYVDAFSYIARDGASQRWLCYCFSAKNGITGTTLSKVFGTAFKACLSNRQRLQKEQGKAPLDVDMVDEGEGVFKKQGTFRYQGRRPAPKPVVTENLIDVTPGTDFSYSPEPAQTPDSNGSIRPRPEAPDHFKRQASMRFPLRPQNENTAEPFKRSASLKIQSSSARQNAPEIKNWSDQLEAIKQLNIQVHNAVPQDSPTTSSISTPSSSLNNNVAWEPADPFNELANRKTFQQPAKASPYSGMIIHHKPSNNMNFVSLDSEPNFNIKI